MDFIAELTWRGLLHQSTDPRLQALLNSEPFTLYAGFDPTADSLHVGHLLPLLVLRRAQLCGHHPIAVVGGATGMIGDPSGKSEERTFLSVEQLDANVAGLRAQMATLLDLSRATLLNNLDWTRELSLLHFLREIGKHFSVNMMLAKDSVKSRLEKEAGISFTEFSYMLLQSFDFLQLYRQHRCRLQVGGSDQWGNITAGIDLIRRLEQAEAFGLTLPLVTKSSGEKFGKTEKGAVWLDPRRTTPYEFYQFFMQTEDKDVGRYLRFYTFLSQQAILALEAQQLAAPDRREAQRALAREVTTLVHGEDETQKAEAAALALFNGDLRRLDEATIRAVFADAPSTELPRGKLGLSLIEVLVTCKVAASNGAARRDIEGGGVYLNNVRVDDAKRGVTVDDLLVDRYVIVRKGRKTHHLVRFI